MSEERWQPVPVPLGDGRHDIGDDMRAAIVQRLISDWSHDPDLTPEKARQLAMWAGASVRALLHELGMLRDLASEMPEIREGDVVDLDGFHLRPVLPGSMRVLRGNDGVRAIYRCVWRRASEPDPS